MILAIDVYYIENQAKTVGILFQHWTDTKSDINTIITDYRNNIAPYQSGQFYQRELPCIMSLLDKIDLSTISAILIDGYVHLAENKIGLGGHLYHALNKTIPIIGIAKKPFTGNSQYLIEIIRGQSKQPLYITAIGIPLENAAANIKLMAGKYRMPDLLSFLDQQTKLFKSEKTNKE
jgi:deoxyribonuclease V